MNIVSTVKENPWKVLFGSAGSIIAIVGAIFTVDARYAHADAVEREFNQTQEVIIDTTNNLRRQMLEDKIWELDVKREQSPNGRLDPYETALRERYIRQLRDLRPSADTSTRN